MIEQVRRFNRVVTQRVGALDDHYLARDRSLGESRVLWEIGSGCDVRTLRARLGLDSGYLSRLLRSLEREGLVEVVASDADQRVRTARLTKAGAAERSLLDRRSDALASSMLAPLDDAQRERLVTAMHDVERLLTASLIEVGPVDPASSEAQTCLRHYFDELDARFDSGFDPNLSLTADVDEMRPPRGVFVVAMLGGEPIGCGALKFDPVEPPYLKRMWVAPEARGLGVGKRLLADLEQRALEAGGRSVRLETNRSLTEAIAMYRAAGYVEVEPFNDERYAHHWFVKRLHPPDKRSRKSRTPRG